MYGSEMPSPFGGKLMILTRACVYHYVLPDRFKTWQETIPYQHFEDGNRNYAKDRYQERLKMTLAIGDVS